jgi:hypothetical protein
MSQTGKKTGRRQSRQVQEGKEGKRVSTSKIRKGKLKKARRKRGRNEVRYLAGGEVNAYDDVRSSCDVIVVAAWPPPNWYSQFPVLFYITSFLCDISPLLFKLRRFLILIYWTFPRLFHHRLGGILQCR